LSSTLTKNEGRLEITHILGVPRAEAFTWWSHREKLQRWSGCAEATRCEIEMDFRIGGTFRQTMDIAGKGIFAFHGIYDEIVEPERISWRAFFGPVTTTVTVQFFEMGEHTRLLITQIGFPDEGSLKTVRQGTEESLMTLDRILTQTALDAEHCVTRKEIQ
jgi:uncharacterized protein YndB with AHSA1/START domain